MAVVLIATIFVAAAAPAAEKAPTKEQGKDATNYQKPAAKAPSKEQVRKEAGSASATAGSRHIYNARL